MNISPSLNYSNPSTFPRLFRQNSGIKIPEDNIENVKFIRSILRNQDGNINPNIIDELFNGLLKIKDLYIEYYGNPSTMIVDNTSVVIASQIYEREFSTHLEKYENVTTYAEYFKTKNSDSITWLGAPSLVYSYKNRKFLKNFLDQDLVINLFFWITSFNSTTCIKDFSPSYDGPYCDKYVNLKSFCSDPVKYRKHNTYFEWKHNFALDQSKFITNFESAIHRIIEEDASITLFNEVINKDKKYYQRYNEVFTLFFPWDVEGIEIGNIPKSELHTFVDLYNEKKTEMIGDFATILADADKITKMNDLIKIILSNSGTKIQKHLTNQKLTYTFFLFTKYVLLANCDITHSIESNYILNESQLETMNALIREIIGILHVPLKFFEYRLNPDDFTFQLVEIELNDRKSPFVLFEQKMNEITKITHVYKSDKQLINNIHRRSNKKGSRTSSKRSVKIRSKH